MSNIRETITRIFKKSAETTQAQADSICTVRCTFNNTHANISTLDGNVVCHSSGGTVGFKGAMRSTAAAAEQVGFAVAQAARERGLELAKVRFYGPVTNRNSVIKGFRDGGMKITHLLDETRLPTNGCRPKKSRRL